MLPVLPKLLDRQFVIGFMAPVAAFLLALATAFPDARTSIDGVLAADKDRLATAARALALTWLLALGLMLLNRPILRLLCGYEWPFGSRSAAERLKHVHKKTTDTLGDTRAKPLYDFRRHYPSRREDVMPTRFGNAMRAYERYPNMAYGLDGVTLWPRLQAVMTTDYRGLVGDAGAQVNFWVHLAVLAIAMALLGSGHFLCEVFLRCPPQPSIAGQGLPWGALAWLPAGLAIAWVAYRLAIERVIAMGEYMRAAFDAYLPQLIVQLGFPVPTSPKARERLNARLMDTYYFHAPMQARWAPTAGGAPVTPAPPAPPAV